MQTLKSFPAVINRSSRILILGSMPGNESLRKNQYYANSRNLFWKIIYALFDAVPDPSYEKRIAFILSKKIALWDVINNCYREGSLDSNIRDEQPNDFINLFRKYPDIKHIIFNGAKAYDSFRRHTGFNDQDGFVYKKLPSSSPAHAVKFDDKLKEWSVIKTYLSGAD
ncbi:MAG TPA: DNA-deoxyinosine glycosylase [Spirochaetota bacterium]|nr:DNA-deoxyinosine glycosylase [Spirochaetota bacterium]